MREHARARPIRPSVALLLLAGAVHAQALVVPEGRGEYYAWRLWVPEPTTVTLGVEGEFLGGSTEGRGFWIHDAAGELQQWLVGRKGTGSHEISVAFGEESVSFVAPLNSLCSVDLVHRIACGPTASLWTTSLDAGEWTVIGMYAVDGEWEGRFVHDWPEGVVVIRQETGPAMLRNDRDFSGTKAYATTAITAKIANSARLHAHAESRLFGYYWGGTNTGSIVMSVMQPDGTALEGKTFYMFAGSLAGGYDFLYDQIDVGGPTQNRVQTDLLWADVVVP